MVRCVDCGFLALRKKFERQELVSAPPCFREKGEMPPLAAVPGIGYRDDFLLEPECHLGVINLKTEATGHARQRYFEVAKRERDCKEFVPLVPGCSLKDHQEMLLLQELRSRQEKWREEDLQWRKEVEEGIERRHRQAEDGLRKARIIDHVLQSLFAFLAAIVALVAAKLIPWFG